MIKLDLTIEEVNGILAAIAYQTEADPLFFKW